MLKIYLNSGFPDINKADEVDPMSKSVNQIPKEGILLAIYGKIFK